MANLNEFNPFTRFCMTIGHLPASYMESLTYEQQLIWLCEFIEKKIIPALDNNAEALKEVQNLYVELKSYVDNYFENLDVQSEINQKLDEMAQDGTLDEIINQNIFSELNDEIDNINTNLSGEIEDLQNELSDFKNNYKNNDFYIILGDSYATGTNTTVNFIDIFKQNNNLSENEVFSNALNGIGFVNSINDKVFLNLLQEVVSNLTTEQKNKITKVLVQCGINDNSYLPETISNAIYNFNEYVKENLPNATVYLAPVGRSANPENNVNIVIRCLEGFNQARKYGVVVVDGAEFCLHDYSLFTDDLFHPNAKGQNKIAECIAEGMKKGSYQAKFYKTFNLLDQFTKDADITSINDVEINTQLNNGFGKITMNNSTYVSVNDITINSDTINLGYFNKLNDDRCLNPLSTNLLIPFTGFAHGEQNNIEGNYLIFGTLYFSVQNGVLNLKMRPSRYFGSNPITNVTGFQIDMFDGTVSGLYS